MKTFEIRNAVIAYDCDNPADDRGYTIVFYGKIDGYELTEQLAFSYIPHNQINPETMLPYFNLSLDPIGLDSDDLTEEAQNRFDSWTGKNIFSPGSELYKELQNRAKEARKIKEWDETPIIATVTYSDGTTDRFNAGYTEGETSEWLLLNETDDFKSVRFVKGEKWIYTVTYESNK